MDNKFTEMHDANERQYKLIPLELRALVTTMMENAFLYGQIYQETKK